MTSRTSAKQPAAPVIGPLMQAVARTSAQFAKSARVFRQGEAANTVLFIESGTVKVTVINKQGKEAIIAILEAGDFVGEGCINNGSSLRNATASATERTTLSIIQKKEMLRALREEKDFSKQFIAYMLRRTLKIEADLVDQLFNSTEKRLARALLLLAHYGKEGSPETVISAISQETLAELVGTTRSRVNFFMNKFRKLGFIKYNGRHDHGLQIHGSLLNIVLHD
jgi:CRP/FNR family cyclic AMP-dependent transcriptional regulator